MNKFNRVVIALTIVLVGILMMVGLVSATTGDKADNSNSINPLTSVESNVYTQPINDWQGLKLFAERAISFQDFMPGQQIMIDTIVVEEGNLVIFWSVR